MQTASALYVHKAPGFLRRVRYNLQQLLVRPNITFKRGDIEITREHMLSIAVRDM